MIGETLSHYRILARLGSGAMGDVYRAEDLRLRTSGRAQDASCAPAGPTRAQRLLAEARAASALNHPNIAVVYEVDEVEQDGACVGFIAMEYVAGRTLADLAAPEPLTLDAILDIAGRSPMPWPKPTRTASCTATSSPRT